MENQQSTTSNKRNKTIVILLFTIAGVLVGSGAIIMTDLGQLFGVSKPVIVTYFMNNVLIIAASFVLMVVAIVLNEKVKFIKRLYIYILCGLWVVAVFSTKYLVPYFMLKSQQNDAEYVSVEKGNEYINDNDIVFVIDWNGVQKAYPREYIWVSHIFGGDFGGDEVVFTYCILTNLPSPYLNDLDGNEVEFRVLAQTNNNLLIWDTNSGEIIQQITQTCEFSNRKLDPIPVLEMTWAGYKKLYPNGEVLYNLWDTPMEKMMNMAMDAEANYVDQWMFKTANFDDLRFPSKEQIIGIRDDELGEQLAISKSFIKDAEIYNVSVGNNHVVLAYFPEYESIVAFEREKDGVVYDIENIDIFGNTYEQGKFERKFVYTGVFWAVWAYYYPDSKVLN